MIDIRHSFQGTSPSRWLRHVINFCCRRVWRTAALQLNFVGSCSTAFPEVLVEIYKYILDASLLIS